MDANLVIVYREKDLLVSGPLSTRYIEITEEALETSFQTLEIEGIAYVESFKLNS